MSDVRAPQRKPLRPVLGTPLTDRQVQVIAGFARGHTSRQIAGRLDIAWQTVDEHRKNISAATGMASRAGIVNFAYEHGYLDGLPPEYRAPVLLKPAYLDVLELMALGLGDDAIARRLFVSLGAVKSRVKILLRKLEVQERQHAVAIGWQQGLLGRRGQAREAA
jgi:DNA-binding NarL/FixJ family response regulator